MMEKNDKICILGGTGVVGKAAYHALKDCGCHFRIGVRQKSEAEKEYEEELKKGTVELFEMDMDRPGSVRSFCHGTDLVIGAVGPSARYSEAMFRLANEEKVPYIDPGGMHLKRIFSNMKTAATAVVGAGLFPGLSGWMLQAAIDPEREADLIETVIGGKYNFSRGAAIDYAEEMKSGTAGIPMACIRNGKIVPAERMVPLNLPEQLSDFEFLPYLTEEIQEIAERQKLLNVDAYTAIPGEMAGILRALKGKKESIATYLMTEKRSEQKAVIWIRQTCHGRSKTAWFDGKAPGELTGKILAVSADAVLQMPQKNGVFLMADYLAGYPLMEHLKKSGF
jgi:NAD(P)-dependent dehydrogenase (short-subunit alcohol dehydrogenase family)